MTEQRKRYIVHTKEDSFEVEADSYVETGQFLNFFVREVGTLREEIREYVGWWPFGRYEVRAKDTPCHSKKYVQAFRLSEVQRLEWLGRQGDAP